jgi:hypothetical protein
MSSEAIMTVLKKYNFVLEHIINIEEMGIAVMKTPKVIAQKSF